MRILLALFLLASVASAQDVTLFHVWSPTRVLNAGTSTWGGTNILRCTAWVTEIGITPTQLAFFVTAGLGGGGTCTIAIYSADGNTKITALDAADCSATGSVAGTVTSSAIVAGTKYQVCTCENTNGGTFLSTVGNVTTLANGMTTAIGSVAANPCVSGVSPATTGVLSAAAVNAPIVLLATDTP